MSKKKTVRRNEIPLAEIKQMLESGLPLRLISRACGYGVPELSLMNKIWGISRVRGRKPKNERKYQTAKGNPMICHAVPDADGLAYGIVSNRDGHIIEDEFLELEDAETRAEQISDINAEFPADDEDESVL